MTDPQDDELDSAAWTWRGPWEGVSLKSTVGAELVCKATHGDTLWLEVERWEGETR
jgi:hypothetical protein